MPGVRSYSRIQQDATHPFVLLVQSGNKKLTSDSALLAEEPYHRPEETYYLHSPRAEEQVREGRRSGDGCAPPQNTLWALILVAGRCPGAYTVGQQEP